MVIFLFPTNELSSSVEILGKSYLVKKETPSNWGRGGVFRVSGLRVSSSRFRYLEFTYLFVDQTIQEINLCFLHLLFLCSPQTVTTNSRPKA